MLRPHWCVVSPAVFDLRRPLCLAFLCGYGELIFFSFGWFICQSISKCIHSYPLSPVSLHAYPSLFVNCEVLCYNSLTEELDRPSVLIYSALPNTLSHNFISLLLLLVLLLLHSRFIFHWLCAYSGSRQSCPFPPLCVVIWQCPLIRFHLTHPWPCSIHGEVTES